MGNDMELTLSDAINTVQVAIALGAEILAPVGSYFFEASVYWAKDTRVEQVVI